MAVGIDIVDNDRYLANPAATRASFAMLSSMRSVDTLDPAALSERQREFLRLIPERNSILEAVVRSTAGFESWTPDWSPASLGRLGSWLAERITTRPRSAEELAAIRQAIKLPIPVRSVDLSDHTISLVYDIAMYFATSLRTWHPHLRWSIILDDKRNMEYGQPVLVGFPKDVPLNPVRIVANLAYLIVDGEAKPGRLEELFGIWSEMADRSSPLH